MTLWCDYPAPSEREIMDPKQPTAVGAKRVGS